VCDHRDFPHPAVGTVVELREARVADGGRVADGVLPRHRLARHTLPHLHARLLPSVTRRGRHSARRSAQRSALRGPASACADGACCRNSQRCRSTHPGSGCRRVGVVLPSSPPLDPPPRRPCGWQGACDVAKVSIVRTEPCAVGGAVWTADVVTCSPSRTTCQCSSRSSSAWLSVNQCRAINLQAKGCVEERVEGHMSAMGRSMRLPAGM
jgi:hypothetical protein